MPFRIIAIDLDNIFRRNWEAAQGQELQAAHLRTLDYVSRLRDGWDRVVIACDGGPRDTPAGAYGWSFRKLRCPEYKGARKDPGAAYREQRRRTIDRLAADGCNVIIGPEVEPGGWAEADDVLAWIAVEHRARAGEGDQLRVVSGDGDLEALVSDAHGVDLLKPGGPLDDAWNEARVLDRQGYRPDQVYDVKALSGDKSDSYDGYKGVGVTNATTLVRTFGGALEVFGRSDDGVPNLAHPIIKPAIRASLEAGGPDLAARGLFLARPRTDLGLDFDRLVLDEPQRGEIPGGGTYFEEQQAEAERPQPTPAPAPAPAPAQSAAPPQKEAPPTTSMVVREARPLAPSVGMDPFALQPRGLGELQSLARCLYNSRAYPQFPNVESVMAAVIEARERGIPAGTALRSAYVVKGRLGWSAAFIAGLVLSSGRAEYFELVPEECDETRATLRFRRVGRPEGKHVYTIKDAQLEGLLGKDSRWMKDPKGMLRWAALRTGARAFFFDVCAGVYGPDELRGGHVEDADLGAEDEA